MKRLSANIVAVMLAGVMCMGLSACNNGNANVEEEAKNFVSTKVSAEQWAAAMAAFQKEEKYTLHYSASFVYEVPGGKVTQTANGQATMDGGNMRFFVDHLISKVEIDEDSKNNIEYYLTKDGWVNMEKFDEEYFFEFERTEGSAMYGNTYGYAKDDEGNWVKYDSPDRYGSIPNRTVLEEELSANFSNFNTNFITRYYEAYEVFSYNEEKNGYYYQMTEAGQEGSSTEGIKFDRECKVAVYSAENSYPDWGGTITVIVYCTFEYTGEEVVLPQIVE